MIFPMKRHISILFGGLFLVLMAGCGKAPPKTDAELHLNVQEARGRHIFKVECASCHHAYSSAGSMGPSLKGLFRRRYLPSGLPANNRFVEGTIVNGRGMMPPIGGNLTPQQLADLMAYLHTL